MLDVKRVHLNNSISFNQMSELSAIYDCRESFYGKAKVLSNDTIKSLFSYDTEIIRLENGKAPKLVYFDKISQTTLRHMKEFLRQNGYNVDTKNEVLSVLQ